MGGDDLGNSDDELQYLAPKPVAQEKRLLGSDDDEDASVADEPVAAKKSNKKQKQSPEQILLNSGRDLEKQTVEQQAKYLTTILRHYALLTSAEDENGDHGEDLVEVLPKYCVKSRLPSENNKQTQASPSALVDQIRSLVSNKKLKKWKHVQSPCVIIVCQSARRAVEILKDVAECKVRIAKLFPKNASVSEQAQQLSTTAFPMAVGTPHRLLQLCRNPSGPSLNLQHTQLVIIDCSLSNKMYTVLTLPDTAKHCAEWLRDFVIPQIQKRNHCRLAFL
jgi:hypothetical protein